MQSVPEKIIERRNACEFYIRHVHKDHKPLYWDDFPEHYLGDSFAISLESATFDWKNNGKFEIQNRTELSPRYGNPFERYTESCEVNMHFVCHHNLIVPFTSVKTIYFEVQTDPPYNDGFQVFIKTDHFNLIQSFESHRQNVQRRFAVDPIGASEFDEKIAFAYYTDIIRKNRIVSRNEERIAHNTFFEQWTTIHGEVAICLSNMLVYFPFVEDMAGNAGVNDGTRYFMPNIDHITHMFLLWCGSAFDRIYNFWESAVVILYAYEQAGLKRMQSFDQYCTELVKHTNNNRAIAFASSSAHLQWLLDFHQIKHKPIQEIRHRIVHHQFTDDYRGILNAKFALKALDAIQDENAVKSLNKELLFLLTTVKEHFDLCKTGFKEILAIVDEIPLKEH